MFPPRPLPLLRSAPSTALYPLYGPLSPLQSSVPLRRHVLSMALCLLYSRLTPPKALCLLFSPLSPSTIFCTLYGSMALFPLCGPLPPMALSSLYGSLFNLYGPLSSLWPPVSSTALCPLFNLYPLYGPLSPLRPFVLSRPSVLSTALCLFYSSFPLYDHLSTLGPSVLSTALCLFYSPLSPLRPYVPSTALCSLWKTARQAKRPSCLVKCFAKCVSSKLQRYRDIFCIIDNRDYRGYHDYHSSEILSDNCKIAIIALAKKVAIIAIITFNKER